MRAFLKTVACFIFISFVNQTRASNDNLEEAITYFGDDGDNYITDFKDPTTLKTQTNYDYLQYLDDKANKKLSGTPSGEDLNANLQNGRAATNDIATTTDKTDKVTVESKCECKRDVKRALISALQSCLNVLKAQERSQNRKKRNADDVTNIMSSCSCNDNVNTALIQSLRSCTDAIGYNSMSPSPPPTTNPPNSSTSCAAIKQANASSTSGYYNLIINDTTKRVYCNMDTLCGMTGGWTRLGSLNMTNRVSRCPTGLIQFNLGDNLRTCGRPGNVLGGCSSVTIPSKNIAYSQVCGRVRGYQRYSTDAFHRSVNNINAPYVDGVSITRGSPRRHIWSFGAGHSDVTTNNRGCPCTTGANASALPPTFVGNDYYCESGASATPGLTVYVNDPLWDGQRCRGREGPCCRPPLLPWFLKNIGAVTTDFIELRVCTNEETQNENVLLDEYEFYVM